MYIIKCIFNEICINGNIRYIDYEMHKDFAGGGGLKNYFV